MRLMITLGLAAAVALAGYYQKTASWELSQYDRKMGSMGFEARSRRDALPGTAIIQRVNGDILAPNKVIVHACLPEQTACYWAEVMEMAEGNLMGGGDWYNKNNKKINPPKGGDRLIQAISTSCAKEWPEWAKSEVRPYLAYLGINI